MNMMHILLAIMLTAVWILLTQDVSALNIMFGFVCAIIGLVAVRRACRDAESGAGGFSVSRLTSMITFTIAVLIDLIRSSLWLAWDIVTPRHYSTPWVVAVPLRIRGDGAITTLGSAITLTPGTLTVDVGTDPSTDKEVLIIHALYSKNAEEVRQEITSIEDRLVPCLDKKESSHDLNRDDGYHHCGVDCGDTGRRSRTFWSNQCRPYRRYRIADRFSDCCLLAVAGWQTWGIHALDVAIGLGLVGFLGSVGLAAALAPERGGIFHQGTGRA